MSDTVSATGAWTPHGSGLTFLTTADAADRYDVGTVHIGGSTQNPSAGPGLIVQFTTLTPDFQSYLPDAAPDPSTQAHAGLTMNVTGSDYGMVLEFKGHSGVASPGAAFRPDGSTSGS